MKKVILSVLILFAFASSALAGSGLIKKCSTIKKEMPQFHVKKILKGPIPGMCEIWAGNNILYYYPDKKLIFFGEIWDTRGHSLTQRSRDLMLAGKIKSLNLKKAIRWGNGKVRVILITDPDCPYCRRTEKFLLSPLFKDKITAHIFLYPLTSIHPHAERDALAVLSSRNPVDTLLGIAGGKKIRPASITKARERLKDMRVEVKKIGVNAVPVIIVGTRVIRGANLEQIMSAINKQLAGGGESRGRKSL